MVIIVSYIPKRGDIVWIDFDPSSGHGQAKRRPAIVVSPALYNRHGLCIVCPVTNQKKGYDYEVEIPNGKVTGVILCDQLKSFDWRARNIKYICPLEPDIFEDAQNKFLTLIE